MAVVQNDFTGNMAAGYAGMIANGEQNNRISRTIEDAAGVGFGKAVYRGVGDHGCTAIQTLTATAAALGTNTGNGTMGAITVSAGAKIGRYTLTIIEAGSNAGTFIVTDPDGVQIGDGAVASAFSAGGLAFTLADGAADFVAGDSFAITVAGNAFLGITIAHQALGILPNGDADTYAQYENVDLATSGPILVKAGGAVADGAPVQVAADSDFVASGGSPLDGWVFDTTGADGDLVVIVKR